MAICDAGESDAKERDFEQRQFNEILRRNKTINTVLEKNTYTGEAVFTPLDANSPEGLGILLNVVLNDIQENKSRLDYFLMR